ncbi:MULTISPECIES: nitronate monooxygenase family protein [unclassified Nocardia]|uniref:NAD(P)H-dependent flavin oxidoreductase n=1 Tax=unclassified Nocardia TaxID=2637762 RepID=UPI001CE491C3|nr:MULTISPECIES: nitronate monooxygenase [unclassified Nocardia]
MLRTDFTELLALRHPIACAPMGGVAGGALASAVAEAGGLGMIGAGTSADRDFLERELGLISTEKPWGVGFLTWGLDMPTVARALESRPAAIMLSFGDPSPYAEAVHAAGAKLIIQVTDLDEARRALDVGADLLVAQGGDAGGHVGRKAIGTLSFVPSVVDLAAGVPVLAAGGIADGRGLAAVLALGAAGAVIGTRFEASFEAVVTAEVTKALLDAHGADTERNTVLDIARGSAWPDRYPARTLRNTVIDRWQHREDELRADTAALAELRAAIDREDPDAMPIWAGQALGLITSVAHADEIVHSIAAEAERILARVNGFRVE